MRRGPPDSSGNGNPLSVWTSETWAGYAYKADVASSVVPQTGAANNFSVKNTGGNPGMWNNTLRTWTPSAWTVEALFKPESGDWRTLVGRDSRGAGTQPNADPNAAALYFQIQPGNRVAVTFQDVMGYQYTAVSAEGAAEAAVGVGTLPFDRGSQPRPSPRCGARVASLRELPSRPRVARPAVGRRQWAARDGARGARAGRRDRAAVHLPRGASRLPRRRRRRLNLRIPNPLPRRWRRRVRRVVRFLFVTAFLLLAFQAFVLPHVVARIVRLGLARIGHPDAAFEVRSATFWHTDIADLSLGRGRTTADVAAISVDYSPLSLIRGRVHVIRFVGAEIPVAVRDGKVDLGPLALGVADRPGATAARGPLDPADLPFDRAELRASTLALTWEERSLWVNADGSAFINADGRLQVDLLARLGGRPIRLVAGFAAADDFNVTATAENLSVPALRAAIPAQHTAGLPVFGSGSLALRATYAQAPASGGRGSLSLRLDRLRLADLAGRPRTRQDLFLRDVLAELSFDVAPAARAATIAAGSRVSVGTLEPVEPGAGPRLTRADPSAPLLAIDLDGAPATVGLAAGGGISADAPSLRLKLAEADLQMPTGLRLAGASAILPLRLWASGGGLALHLRPGARLAFTSLDVPLARGTPQAPAFDLLSVRSAAAAAADDDDGPVTLDLASSEGQRLFEMWTADDGEPHATLDLVAAAPAGLAVTSSTLEARGRSLVVTAGVRVRPDVAPALTGSVRLADGLIDLADDGLRIEGLRADVPLAWNTDLRERGEFAFASARVGKAELPAARGRLGMAGGRIQLDADWAVLRNGVVRAEATLDLQATPLRGQVRATLPPFAIVPDDKPTIAALVPALADYEVGGTLSGGGQLGFSGDDVTARVEASLRDGRLANPKTQWLIEGIATDEGRPLVFDSIGPVGTPGGQRLRVARAKLGKLDLADGLVDFRLESAERVHFEQTSFGFAGGTLYASAFRLDLSQGRLETVVSADKLRLGELLKLGTDQVGGEGTLYGRLPLRVEWARTPDGAVDWGRWMPYIGEGFLYATPGTGGRLSFANPEAVLDTVLAQDAELARRPDFQQLRRRMLESLRNLEYTVLKADFVKDEKERPADGRVRAVVFVSGRGAGPEGIPFGGLTFNIRGFDELVRTLIGLGSSLSFDPAKGR